MPSLKQSFKQKTLSSLVSVLKACIKQDTRMISFETIHQMNNRATPEKLMIYKHSLALYRLCNLVQKPTIEWCALNVNQIFTSRQTMFKTMKNNNLKVGLNALANRLYILNEKTPLRWLDGGFETFKVKCKDLFLK